MALTSADVKEQVEAETGLSYGGGDIRDTPDLGWVRVTGEKETLTSFISSLSEWTYTDEPPLSAAERSTEQNKFYIVPTAE